MATRLKNRKEQEPKREKSKGLSGTNLIVWMLCLSAALAFLLLYPGFQEKAEEEEPDILSGSEFLHEIYQANIVLYRQLQEAVMGKKVNAQDIYLAEATNKAEGYQGEYYDFDGETPLSYAGERLDALLDSWETDMSGGIDAFDYEIIDNMSGKRLGKSEHPLTLLGTEEVSQETADYYPYFIKMEFDEIGKLARVWARGEDGDAIAEGASVVMRSRYLQRSLYESLSYSAYGNIDWDDYIFYLADGEVWRTHLRVTNLPTNCTVCYAMTEAQFAQLKASSRLFHSVNSFIGNYANIGIRECFRFLLILLFIISLLLPFWRGWHLHEKQFLPLHFEVTAVLLAAAFVLFGELSVQLVLLSMSSRWDYSLPYTLHSLLPGLSLQDTKVIVLIGNFLLLTAVFRLWLALAAPLGQVYVLGFRGYFRKQSLIVRGIRRLRVVLKRSRRRQKKANWQKKYGFLLLALQSVSEGNLQAEFSGDWGEFEPLKGELSKIQDGFTRAVEEEVKSQRMRTELITNVSHDLKTPLTAILTYTELLQGKNVTEKQREEYLAVLRRKSLRLKTLIEDLFEVSKASSGNVTFEREKVDICSLMRQVFMEYEDGAKAAGLTFRFQFPDEKVFLLLDGEKTCRIFDNLYTNILKYAMTDTRVYISAAREGEDVRIELKNISGTELNIPAESLTERFVRGDSARSSEGSGLGLAIARSFVEGQEGRMQIEIDGDLFKVTLIWPIYP